MNENMFRSKLLDLDLGLNYINRQIISLTNCGMLPLHNQNPNLSVLAKIFGFLLADGSINIYTRGTKYAACSFDFGTENDVKMFEYDIQLCGFNSCKYSKGTREFNNIKHCNRCKWRTGFE
jgi:hypothetical protein